MLALRLHVVRSWRELSRDTVGLMFKYIMNTFFSVLFGLVYFQLGKEQVDLQNRNGILFFVAMNQVIRVLRCEGC